MKYIQIDDTGYTPDGKWRVVPSEITDTELHAAYRSALGQSIRERDMTEIRKFAHAIIKTAPPPPAELLLSGEPVCGVLIMDEGESWPQFYREKDQILWKLPVGDYQLYLHPAPDSDTMRDAERLAWVASEYAYIQPFSIPTGEGDFNTGWRVLQDRCGESKPKVLAEIFTDSLRETIDAARGAK